MSVENSNLAAEIRQLARQKNAVIMAHFYTRPEVQDVADFVGDSLALAQRAAATDARMIIMCGVHFMGETNKILCPGKKVIVPDPAATCSLAESCPAEDFERFVRERPGSTVVSYVNTTAAVKALTDVVVTSGNAMKIVSALPADAKIIFGPDKNLGAYINAVTGRDMTLWDGACHVHSRFSVEGILQLRQQHPQAEVLAHPECNAAVLRLAHKIGSTAVLLKYAQESVCQDFIVVTESGILHKMRLACPEKNFIPAPPELSEGSVGCHCNECEYMRMITLEKIRQCLIDEAPEITVDPQIAEKALRPINRMLEMS